ncbi:MAG: DUF2510 domain-containing protein [Actinobacteria bacterium]|nr:DUF2510 domain-containing protein [Actinomycetota bacterium]
MADPSYAALVQGTTGGSCGSDVDETHLSRQRPAGPGWYRDPRDASRQRFWDGAAWSSPVTAGTPATVDSVPRLLAG